MSVLRSSRSRSAARIMALLLPGLLSLTLVPAAFADTEVTPTEPTATTPTCDNPDVTVTPDSQGGQIIWNPEGPTTITPGYQVDYAATPAPGVVFPDGSCTFPKRPAAS